MITIYCPHCGQKFESSSSIKASVIDCTTCHQQFQIPDLTLDSIEPRIPSLPSLSPFDSGPGGINRAVFLLINLFISIFVFFAYMGLASKAEEGLTRESILVLEFVIVSIAAFTSIAAFFSRLKNMSVSTLWTLVIFVPVINFIATLGLLAYPPRYGVSKKIDTLGRVILISFLVIFIAFVFRSRAMNTR